MKDELTRRGLTPTVPGWEHLSPMEHSTLIHAETVHMADMLGERAYAAGKNVIYDSSMGGREGPASRLERMREHGYTTRGIFVDIPVETSVERATSRYRQGQRQWLAGEGPGGRPIPPSFILAQRGSGGQTVNRQVFEGLARDGLFDQWDVYDNSGSTPRPVARGGGGSFRMTAQAAAARPDLLTGQHEVRDPVGNWIVPRAVKPGAKAGRLSIQVQPISGRNLNPTTHAFMVWDSDELQFRPRSAS